MNRRISLIIAIIGINLMACCCGGVGNVPQQAQQGAVAKSIQTKAVNPVPPQADPPIKQKADPEPQPIAKKVPDLGRVYVSREQMGDKWPLTVADGEIEGYKVTTFGFERRIVVFHSGSKSYAVNGAAIDQRKWSDISEIWADEPRSEFWIKNNIPAIKKSISPLIEIGLELSKTHRK